MAKMSANKAHQGKEEQVIKALRAEIARRSREAYRRRLVEGSSGNISARIPGTDRVLITPSGLSLGDVRPEILLVVGLDGEPLEVPEGCRPSKETPFHTAIYRLRPDIGAVVHTHPPYATSYSTTGLPLPLVTYTGRMLLGEVPCVGLATPGSLELSNQVSDMVAKHPGALGFLMQEHGVLAIGVDLVSAYYNAELVEDSAKVAYLSAFLNKSTS